MLTEALYLLTILSIIIFLIYASIYLIFLSYSWLKGAPYVATEHDDIADALAQAQFKKGDYFIDLGCGDGRILRYAAQKYHIHGMGIDINPLLILVARIRTWITGLKHIEYRRANILDCDLSKANVIYLYLLPRFIQMIKQQLVQAAHNHTLIISHAFCIPYLEKHLIQQRKGTVFTTYYYQIIDAKQTHISV